MVSIIIERSFEKMVVLGVYLENYSYADVRGIANHLNEINSECDVDVLQFDSIDDLNRFLLDETGFIS